MAKAPTLQRTIQDSTWAHRIRRRLLSADGIIVVIGPMGSGVEFVLGDLGTASWPLVWVTFDDLDDGDPYSQGAKVSAALEATVGAAPLGFGRSITEVLAVTAQEHHALGPFTFCFSTIGSIAGILESLLDLHRRGSRIIVHLRQYPSSIDGLDGTGVQLVTERDLYLTQSEARDILSRYGIHEFTLDPDQPSGLTDLLHRCLPVEELELLIVPSPGGASLPYPKTMGKMNASAVAQALIGRGRTRDALELLMRHGLPVPDSVADIGCRSYLDEGLKDRLWRLFTAMPRAMRSSSDVLMRWYFAAATIQNKHNHIRDEIQTYLADHEAPELRSLFAAAFPGPNFLREAVRAHRALESPTTLRIRAFATGLKSAGGDPAKYLHKALRMSEHIGDNSAVVASATDLADLSLRTGSYRDATSWSEWAVDWYRRSGCRDELRLHVATSIGTYGRLLAGEPTEPLDFHDPHDLLVGIPTLEAVFTTAAEQSFVRGDLRRAECLLSAMLPKVQLSQFSRLAVDLVHVFKHQGRHTEAASLANRALLVSERLEGSARALGSLAYGIAHLDGKTPGAEDRLTCAINALSATREAPRLAQAAIMLARLRLQDDDQDGVRKALQLGATGLRELGGTGWRLLGGLGEDLQLLQEVYSGRPRGLELVFLGSGIVRQDRADLRIGLRQCEALFALMANPKGLSCEALGARLYGEMPNLSTIKAIVSRLRQLVPIASRPYRILEPLRADFIEVENHVAAGRYWDALALYRGPLLPGSDAPVVVEARRHLEQLITRVVIDSGELGALLRLAEIIRDDLALVDAVLDHLPESDRRRPAVIARRDQLANEWGVA